MGEVGYAEQVLLDGVAREDEPDRVGELAADLAEERAAVHPGHAEVGHDDGGGSGGERLQRCPAVALEARVPGAAVVPEHPPEASQHARFVVNEEDPAHGFAARASRGTSHGIAKRTTIDRPRWSMPSLISNIQSARDGQT